jgi:protein-disulfide isomerase
MDSATRFSNHLRNVGLVIALAVLVLLAAATSRAQTEQARYPIKADHGSPVANTRVPAELLNAIEQLPGTVTIGERNGDVTLVEFYDLNCPFCRKAASDIADIIRADKGLKLILVSFPVLSVASIEAARVELAVGQQIDPARFYDFHRKLYAGRGVVDGARALAVASQSGLDTRKLVEMANRDDITNVMKSHVRLGDALGLSATPSFVIKGVAILGYPGRKALESIIQSARRCGSVVC